MSRSRIILIFISILLPILSFSQKSDSVSFADIDTEQMLTSQALVGYLKALDSLEKDNPKYLDNCLGLANIYQKEKLDQQALPYFKEAIKIVELDSGNDAQQLFIYQALADTYLNLNQYDSADFMYEKVLDRKANSQDLEGLIKSLQHIAKGFTSKGAHQRALSYHLRTEEVLNARKTSNELQLAIFNNLGFAYNNLGNYDASISYFSKALSLLGPEENKEAVTLNTNLGIASFNVGNFNESVTYLLAARKDIQKYFPAQLPEIDHLLSNVYLQKEDIHTALGYTDRALEQAEVAGMDTLLVDIYYTSALIYAELYEYEKALAFFQKHLELKESFESSQRMRQNNISRLQLELERTEKQFKLFTIQQDIQELTIAQLKADAENQGLLIRNQQAELLTQQSQQEILVKNKVLAEQTLRIERQNSQALIRAGELRDLQQIEKMQELEIERKESQLVVEQNEKTILLKGKEIDELAIKTQKERSSFLLGLGLLLALIAIITVAGLLRTRKLNSRLNQQNQEIEIQKQELDVEKKKADGLLLNILPEQIAKELKETGKAAAKKYDDVTILFSDFKDFTVIASQIPATTLIAELNDIFSHFDDVMDEFAIEKIETIGDAYMAACGLPEDNEEHALRCVSAAHAMIKFVDERNLTHKQQWKIRIGVHSGPVVAGVVGKKKFAYDLFGDTVNTAARIESNGEAGRVNISESTYDLVKQADEFSFESRGKISAKGKGELEMWFVDRV